MGGVVAVFLGGMLGTAARLALDDLLPHHDDTFPWSTLVINVIGSLLLGFLVARVWPLVRPWVRAGLGPGILGGFTTFSAVIAAIVTLTASGHLVLAIGYLAATLVLGIGAAALGLRLGRRRASAPAHRGDRVIAFLAAVIGGGLASVVRYLLTLAFAGRGALPWAVFVVNSVGSGLGGVLVGLSATASLSSDARLLLLGGVAGGLTTFSTWSTETVQLAMAGKWSTAIVNVVLGLAVGLSAATGGYLLATAVS